jgi:hypothetical protein
MKLTRTIKFIVVLLGAVLFGCAADPRERSAMPSVPTSSSTPAISASTPTPVPSPTITAPVILPTPLTPVPTLRPKEAEVYMLELIETNAGCILPCFLGIVPGRSSWEDLRNLESPIYFRESYVPGEDGKIGMDFTFSRNRVNNLSITFRGSGELIQYLSVETRIYPQDDYSFKFAKVLEQYSIENVMRNFGKPSRILLGAHGKIEPGAGTAATIMLFYDDLGILVDYWFENVVTRDQTTYALHICPDFAHTSAIDFYLRSPTGSIPLENIYCQKFLNPKGGECLMDGYLQPPENSTALSSEDFYRLFVEPAGKPCFDIP